MSIEITREWLDTQFDRSESMDSGYFRWEKDVELCEGGTTVVCVDEFDRATGEVSLLLYATTETTDGTVKEGVTLGFFLEREQVVEMVNLVIKGHEGSSNETIQAISL